MAKTEKVKNRKLRRRVRRTSAIILLITSIIVAAIPVPENAAAPGDPTPAAPDRNEDDYTYDVDAVADSIDTSNGISLVKGNAREYEAYMVVESGGTYIYQWQFKYFLKELDIGAGNVSVISAYNPTYINQNLDMPNSVPTEYELITLEQYNKFIDKRVVGASDFGQNGNEGYVIELVSPTDTATTSGYNPVTGSSARIRFSNVDIVKKYFPDAFNAYQSEYNAYLEAHKDDPDPSLGAPTRRFDFGGLSSDKLLEYYCDTSVSSLDENVFLKGFALQVVSNRTDSTPDNPVAVQAYIPKAIEGQIQNTGLFSVDSNGFVCGASTPSIGAIGNEAFKNVRNVGTLSLPKDVKYIGDNAFEDSFITSLTAHGLIGIGNSAFKNCGSLASVTVKGDAVSSSLSVIGTEAFRGADILTEFEMPTSLTEIGPGAFAYCKTLKSIKFESGGHRECKIDKYAFYDCPALSEVDWNDGSASITKIEKAAFAMSSSMGSMETFRFPEGSSSSGLTLEDCILAGRGALENVYIPASSYGRATLVTFPEKTFLNCYAL